MFIMGSIASNMKFILLDKSSEKSQKKLAHKHKSRTKNLHTKAKSRRKNLQQNTKTRRKNLHKNIKMRKMLERGNTVQVLNG